jgi:hypothetical protein
MSDIDFNGFRIDHSTGTPILMYKDCSVIESEVAEWLMQLIANHRTQPPAEDAKPEQQEQSGEVVDAYNLHCKTCNGHGFVTYSVRHGESDFEDFEQECPVCDGAGKAPKHVQDLQARYQEVRSELHALNMKIGMDSVLAKSSNSKWSM